MNNETMSVADATSVLTKATGKSWTENNLFVVIIKYLGGLEAELPNAFAVRARRFDAGNRLIDEKITTSTIAKLTKQELCDLLNGTVNSKFAQFHEEVCYSIPPTNENLPDVEDEDELEYLERNEFVVPVAVTIDMVRVPIEFVDELKENESMWAAGLPDVTPSVLAIESPSHKSIAKKQVVEAFDGVCFDYYHWGRNLATPPKWLKPCRVSQGNKGNPSTWNPVKIAEALLKKGITLKQLNTAFAGLKDWQEEWKDFRATLPNYYD